MQFHRRLNDDRTQPRFVKSLKFVTGQKSYLCALEILVEAHLARVLKLRERLPT
jgi:hypothetical protein